MKSKLLRFLCILITPLSLIACNKGNQTTDYFHNHESHWAYNKDCNKVNESAHKFNKEHKCTVCGYEDPILLINNDGVLTGLTEHGKTLENITLTNKVHFIDGNAFNGSKAKKIHLSDSIFGMNAKAYDYISNIQYETEGQVPELEKVNETYYIRDLFKDGYECYVGNKKYEYLSDALLDLKENNSIIYLLKDEININKKVELSLETRIANAPESNLNSKIAINNPLVINASGVLEFSEEIEVKGEIDLKLREIKGNYTTGAVAFQGLTEAPANASIKYISEPALQHDVYVRGAVQTRNEAIFFPTDYYAYGTLEFNRTFTEVTGLSPYGLTITKLTITSPNLNADATIVSYAFTEKYNKTIKFLKEFVNFTLWAVEGSFTHLTIGDGITCVGRNAFYSYIESKVSDAINKFITILFCHLTSLTIGKECSYIEPNAFGFSYNLTTINGGAGLEQIDTAAFAGSRDLKQVDLSSATKLKLIDRAFTNCYLLSSVTLPKSNGWRFGANTMLYEDLTPEHVAQHLISGVKLTKDAAIDSCSFAVYNPVYKDKFNVPNIVRYFKKFEDAINDTRDDDVIKLLNQNNDFHDTTFDINKNIIIDGSKAFNEKASLKCNFKVNKNCSIKFTDKVNHEGTITYL